ncbi:MAG: T9SS type A sorting domain-containing protein [Bacteroidota bacterium]
MFTHTLSAQTFTESPQFPPLEGVEFSDVSFADVDGDNDKDVLITGQTSTGELISKLYRNDGTGMFTEMMGTPFPGLGYGSVAFADVDNDNDQDLLMTGRSTLPGTQIAKLYRNDGMGNFTEVMGTPFRGTEFGSVAFADVDGDNDQDVLIAGQRTNGLRYTNLYLNDGSGGFTEKSGTSFEGVAGGAVAFADVDGDNDQDLLITGSNSINGPNALGLPVTKQYTNDGAGNFSEKMGTAFVGLTSSAVAFADFDGDNDQDVFITGSGIIRDISRVYTNDGAGNFTQTTPPLPETISSNSVAVADVDGDTDQDIFVAGLNQSGTIIATLFTNDGAGVFTELVGASFENVAGSVAFADVDGDADPDVLLTGQGNAIGPTAKLYLNDGIISSNDPLSSFPFELHVFPNPSPASTLYLRCDLPEQGEATIRIYNVHGALLLQQEESFTSGQQTISLEVASFPKGQYFLELVDGKIKGSASFVIQ